jgi:hypothetical protein
MGVQYYIRFHFGVEEWRIEHIENGRPRSLLELWMIPYGYDILQDLPLTMPKLSLIKGEAERLAGRLSEPKRREFQQRLLDLCEKHWPEIRGPEPATPLDHALWSIAPPLSDLFADLFAAGDGRLDDVLQGHKPEWGLALLVLAEIERGDAEGARLAHELMMVFDSTELDVYYAVQITSALRGQMEPRPLSRQGLRQPLWRALGVMSAHIKRWDLTAIILVIRLLSSAPETSDTLGQLRAELEETGIHFLGVEDHFVFYEQHGHEHKPVSVNQLAEVLFSIRKGSFG